jgi:hypothetical protein
VIAKVLTHPYGLGRVLTLSGRSRALDIEREAVPLIELARRNIDAASEQSENPCHLLDKMPPELRNQIWKPALSYADGVVTRTLLRRNPIILSMTYRHISQECEGLPSEQTELRL